ncbi:hypothetical protein CPB85DRAFT_110659 [Mucidula mucida]|nr:hypothetical protein CPB85DRAFT_110659 [Mucidula mucida]
MTDLGVVPNGLQKGDNARGFCNVLSNWLRPRTRPCMFFPDLTNGFSWTNHGIMWCMLYRKGAGGPIFDWLRMLYGSMSYVVRLGAAPFATTTGFSLVTRPLQRYGSLSRLTCASPLMGKTPLWREQS